nr:MazG-like family protein [Sporosarcina sp. P18a]
MRGLDDADPVKQMLKLMEEVGEVAAALARGDMAAVKDGIGDVYVVQTILSMQLGTSVEECASIAYEEIKDRKGDMVNGVFVKESDLV